MKKQLSCLVMATALLLCACSVSMRQEVNVNPDTDNQDITTQTDGPETSGSVETTIATEPATVPLVPEGTDYTGPTLNASEGVGDWNETGNADVTVNTGSTETTPPQQNTQPTTEPNHSAGPQLISYEEYLDMSTAQKQEYFLSFGDPEAFYAWLEPLEDAYLATKDQQSGNGSLDISTVPTGN